ncbi:MAG: DNA repair protein RecO [Steroidobacteraceae bacterium]|nr:DNA repair protein RecO [Steroidobacteraceae bacterium]
MTRTLRKADQALAYVLHHRPYRDTSRIIELFSREHGRLTVFAQGARGPKSRSASLLQPFVRLLVSWRGHGEAATLTGVERGAAADDDRVPGLPAAAMMSGFYLNELLLRLTTRDDPHPELFDAYAVTLARLAGGEAPPAPLRAFERRLLDELGYGVDLAVEMDSGRSIDPDGRYVYRAGQGVARAVADAPGAVAGRSLIHLAEDRLQGRQELDDARRVLRAALDYCLEGRELTTRAVARAMAGKESG